MNPADLKRRIFQAEDKNGKLVSMVECLCGKTMLSKNHAAHRKSCRVVRQFVGTLPAQSQSSLAAGSAKCSPSQPEHDHLTPEPPESDEMPPSKIRRVTAQTVNETSDVIDSDDDVCSKTAKEDISKHYETEDDTTIYEMECSGHTTCNGQEDPGVQEEAGVQEEPATQGNSSDRGPDAISNVQVRHVNKYVDVPGFAPTPVYGIEGKSSCGSRSASDEDHPVGLWKRAWTTASSANPVSVTIPQQRNVEAPRGDTTQWPMIDPKLFGAYRLCLFRDQARNLSQVNQDIVKVAKFIKGVAMFRTRVEDEPESDESIMASQVELLMDQGAHRAFIERVMDPNIQPGSVAHFLDTTGRYIKWVMMHHNQTLPEGYPHALLASIGNLEAMATGRKRTGKRHAKKRNTKEALERKGQWATHEEVEEVLNIAEKILFEPTLTKSIMTKAARVGYDLPQQYFRDIRTFAMMLAHHSCAAGRGGELPSLLYESTMKKLEGSREPEITISEFKTSDTYDYKSFIMDQKTRKAFWFYGKYVRPYVLEANPTIEPPVYFFINNDAGKWMSSGRDMTAFTEKYSEGRFKLNSTRMRQMEATEVASRATNQEQVEIMAQNRGHSSVVSDTHYNKLNAVHNARQARIVRQQLNLRSDTVGKYIGQALESDDEVQTAATDEESTEGTQGKNNSPISSDMRVGLQKAVNDETSSVPSEVPGFVPHAPGRTIITRKVRRKSSVTKF